MKKRKRRRLIPVKGMPSAARFHIKAKRRRAAEPDVRRRSGIHAQLLNLSEAEEDKQCS